MLNVLGMYPGDPGPPGSDCAAVVMRAGKGVTHLKPGKKSNCLHYAKVCMQEFSSMAGKLAGI